MFLGEVEIELEFGFEEFAEFAREGAREKRDFERQRKSRCWS